MGDLSAHFSACELMCPHCGQLRYDPRLIPMLEATRARFYPRGLKVVSGYRCAVHNAAVGGATQSQHLITAAVDVPPVMTFGQAEHLGWTGIGVDVHRKVVHIDLRSGRARWSYDALGREAPW